MSIITSIDGNDKFTLKELNEKYPDKTLVKVVINSGDDVQQKLNAELDSKKSDPNFDDILVYPEYSESSPKSSSKDKDDSMDPKDGKIKSEDPTEGDVPLLPNPDSVKQESPSPVKVKTMEQVNIKSEKYSGDSPYLDDALITETTTQLTTQYPFISVKEMDFPTTLSFKFHEREDVIVFSFKPKYSINEFENFDALINERFKLAIQIVKDYDHLFTMPSGTVLDDVWKEGDLLPAGKRGFDIFQLRDSIIQGKEKGVLNSMVKDLYVQKKNSVSGISKHGVRDEFMRIISGIQFEHEFKLTEFFNALNESRLSDYKDAFDYFSLFDNEHWVSRKINDVKFPNDQYYVRKPPLRGNVMHLCSKYLPLRETFVGIWRGILSDILLPTTEGRSESNYLAKGLNQNIFATSHNNDIVNKISPVVGRKWYSDVLLSLCFGKFCGIQTPNMEYTSRRPMDVILAIVDRLLTPMQCLTAVGIINANNKVASLLPFFPDFLKEHYVFDASGKNLNTFDYLYQNLITRSCFKPGRMLDALRKYFLVTRTGGGYSSGGFISSYAIPVESRVTGRDYWYIDWFDTDISDSGDILPRQFEYLGELVAALSPASFDRSRSSNASTVVYSTLDYILSKGDIFKRLSYDLARMVRQVASLSIFFPLRPSDIDLSELGVSLKSVTDRLILPIDKHGAWSFLMTASTESAVFPPISYELISKVDNIDWYFSILPDVMRTVDARMVEKRYNKIDKVKMSMSIMHDFDPVLTSILESKFMNQMFIETIDWKSKAFLVNSEWSMSINFVENIIREYPHHFGYTDKFYFSSFNKNMFPKLYDDLYGYDKDMVKLNKIPVHKLNLQKLTDLINNRQYVPLKRNAYKNGEVIEYHVPVKIGDVIDHTSAFHESLPYSIDPNKGFFQTKQIDVHGFLERDHVNQDDYDFDEYEEPRYLLPFIPFTINGRLEVLQNNLRHFEVRKYPALEFTNFSRVASLVDTGRYEIS
jgi:hypothetical protein